ncbi:CPBP family intramembrane glutamic endopeptidase [Christiangramia sabulilitoris]|uniref:CPBP family intramembrane metalloprotease n=1 Tax=Christiangramia sabulilitoris TaxID=2583991 RepID=A0A550I0P0_9FLAO|nr:CPBP family intramembrane glutamic endopeptidase [Christiangramia sabulilitoris]TRO64515.1 CPBP family intramembrane metalloprotease [Christiangramia sabulilitoris]
MKTVSIAILLFLLILSLFNSKRDLRKYNTFKALTGTSERQAMFKKMLLESFLIYGCLGLLALYILGRFSALTQFPDFLMEYSTYLRSFRIHNIEEITLIKILKLALVYLIPFLLLATTLLNLIMVYVQHKKTDEKSTEVSPDAINHLMPRNAAERSWVTLISINAGFSEEIFFRLLLPILFFNIFGSSLISVLLASLWFGLVHAYQGISGIISTLIAGLMLFYIFILTQNIWITILVHIILDLNGLVITPLFNNFLEQKSASKIA